MFAFRKTLSALVFSAASGLTALPAFAECVGQNLFDQMPAEERAAIEAKTKAQPFSHGNFWQATRDGQQITLVGTYHLDDPRHSETMAHLAPLVDAADLLLVEAGPEEEKALMQRIGSDPSLMVITDGPPLNELLAPELWDRLSQAAEARGIPPFMAAKFRPWYLSVMLALPPCSMEAMAKPNGLDHQLITRATEAGTPIKALEPYDTLFAIFDLLSEDDQVAMIEQTLAMEDRITDFSITLADAYFSGDSYMTWELMREIAYDTPGYTREEIDADMAQMEDVLMIRRNVAWIPVIETAAAEGAAMEGETVVAFGALHLPGEKGVLNLLEQNGWSLKPLNF